MAASTEEVSYEFGNLLGVAMLGGLLTMVYTRMLILPEGAEEWSSASPSGALSSGNEAVTAAASAAFQDAYLVVLIAVALVTALGAAGVSWILRRYTPGTESQAYPDNH